MIHVHHTLLLLAALLLSSASHAHKRWLLPTDFALSDAETVTVDFTASNNIFYVDKGMPLEIVTVTGPQGEDIPLANATQGDRRSSFDIPVDVPGTYRIAAGGPPMYFVSYQLPGQAELQHARGSLQQLKAGVPAAATEVKFAESHSLIESYITLGAQTTPARPEDSSGLQMRISQSHPNALYSDEEAQFRFELDGEPAAGLTVTVQPDGSRYRDDPLELGLVTDDDGTVTIEWPGPGRYLLEAGLEQTAGDGDIARRYYSYFPTVEVLAP